MPKSELFVSKTLVPFPSFPAPLDPPFKSKIMLKRNLGRSLIMLLVVTGLAGTVNTNALSKKERKHAVTMMKDTRADALNSVKGLSAAQLDFKAAPEKWSVKECMYHIAATEKFLWGMLDEAMKKPADPERRKELKFTDDQLVNMVQDRSSKFQTTEPMQPKNSGFQSLDQALEDFKKSRGEHIKYMKSSTEDMRNHFVQMPFGIMDCYQFSLFIAGHSNRHTQQIREVIANPNFPKQ